MTELTPETHAALTFQEYGPQPPIDGVWHKPLRKHRAENGAFMELARLTNGGVDGLPASFSPRQISVSHAEGGRINAFHLHPREPQNEIWSVVAGLLRVWLVDCRADSPTVGNRRAFVLSGEEPAMLYIPAGVAHGYRAGVHGATLLYMMDQQFDLERPNEGRLPWDHFGAELWSEDRG